MKPWQYGKLHPVMETVVEVMDKFKDACEFHFNSQCGFLTVDPFRCGTGVRVSEPTRCYGQVGS